MTDTWTEPTDEQLDNLLRWLREEVRPEAQERHLRRDEEDYE